MATSTIKPSAARRLKPIDAGSSGTCQGCGIEVTSAVRWTGGDVIVNRVRAPPKPGPSQPADTVCTPGSASPGTDTRSSEADPSPEGTCEPIRTPSSRNSTSAQDANPRADRSIDPPGGAASPPPTAFTDTARRAAVGAEGEGIGAGVGEAAGNGAGPPGVGKVNNGGGEGTSAAGASGRGTGSGASAGGRAGGCGPGGAGSSFTIVPTPSASSIRNPSPSGVRFTWKISSGSNTWSPLTTTLISTPGLAIVSWTDPKTSTKSDPPMADTPEVV